MRVLAFRFIVPAALVALESVAVPLAAQDFHLMAQAIALYTRADPTAGRRALDEVYLTQPLVMAHAGFGVVQTAATIDLEGLTLRRGELDTGAYGEGYVDRRHPHTFIHELMLGTTRAWKPVDVSLFGGRGFVPFGSDDPMVRPIEKYPINHHLAQILERFVAVAAVHAGPVIAEAAAYNGDEPLAPGAAPRFRRFGDSWAGRVTLVSPIPTLGFSASFASTRSPEQPSGQGLDQRKGSLVVRWSDPLASGAPYFLAEWARTDERDVASTVTTLRSVLAEGSVCRAGVRVAARAERTDRPEEQPLLDPFRTARPANDLGNLGLSRWTALTASVSLPSALLHSFALRPFVEAAYISTRPGVPAGLFDPRLRYGSSTMWMYTAGVRLVTGTAHMRMGRYGVADPMPSIEGVAHHEHGSEMQTRLQSSAERCA